MVVHQTGCVFGGLVDTRQLPTRPGAADDESTYESCSSASLSLFSEDISGDVWDPVGYVCMSLGKEW